MINIRSKSNKHRAGIRNRLWLKVGEHEGKNEILGLS
jgi:hypothetical protein